MPINPAGIFSQLYDPNMPLKTTEAIHRGQAEGQLAEQRKQQMRIGAISEQAGQMGLQQNIAAGETQQLGKGLIQGAMEAYKANDMGLFNSKIKDAMLYVPEEAKTLQTTLGETDRTNAVGAAHNLLAAAKFKPEDSEGIQNSIEKAIDIVNPSSGMGQMLQRLKGMEGVDLQNGLTEAIEFAKSTGLLDSMTAQEAEAAKTKATAGKTKLVSLEKLQSAVDTQLKEYRMTESAHNRITNIADAARKGNSPAAQLALIFNFMKMQDPNSVVRESEFQMAEQARAWVEKVDSGEIKINKEALPFYSTIRKAALGQRMTPKQVDDFISVTDNLFKGAQKSADSVIADIVDRGEGMEIEGARILGKKRFKSFQDRQAKMAGQAKRKDWKKATNKTTGEVVALNPDTGKWESVEE